MTTTLPRPLWLMLFSVWLSPALGSPKCGVQVPHSKRSPCRVKQGASAGKLHWYSIKRCKAASTRSLDATNFLLFSAPTARLQLHEEGRNLNAGRVGEHATVTVQYAYNARRRVGLLLTARPSSPAGWFPQQSTGQLERRRQAVHGESGEA